MGASGTKLYSDDYACDVRADYIHKLRLGQSNEIATEELIKSNEFVVGDKEEEPTFWFALADTQWDYGRLEDYVKNKALYFLEETGELERWAESGEKQLNGWLETRKELKNKLLSPQPKEKKISSYRLYKCKWQLGDVYAYKFSGEYSREKEDFGKYIIFRKVSEDEWWPGHIVPVVTFYKWMGKTLPSLGELKNLPLLPQSYLPIAYVNHPNLKIEYKIKLIITTERMIPKNNLIFLGNICGNDLMPYNGEYHSYPYVSWKKFEFELLNQYCAWKDQSEETIKTNQGTLL